MNKNYIFWAQPLDNAAPDIVYRYGKELAPDLAAERQKAVSDFSIVVKRGSIVCEANGVRIISSGQHFFAEVPCEQKDHANRVAPIVCSGPLGNLAEDFASIVVDNIQEFAKHIDRTIAPKNLDILQNGFCNLRKKNIQKRILWAAAIAGAALLAWWLLSKQ
jgi:hypothetical protein